MISLQKAGKNNQNSARTNFISNILPIGKFHLMKFGFCRQQPWRICHGF
jgi:hypothetical protein